jgi:hypothetical protein
MKFWKGNRLDAKFDMPVQAMAEQFVSAIARDEDLKLKAEYWPLDRALRGWLTSPGGFNVSWEDHDDYEDLIEAVRIQLHLHAEAMDPAPQLTPGGWRHDDRGR